jgi:hypothetical protein
METTGKQKTKAEIESWKNETENGNKEGRLVRQASCGILARLKPRRPDSNHLADSSHLGRFSG